MSRKWAVGIGIGLAIAAAAREPPPLEGSAAIEARNIRVGSKVGGRIAEVKVREGDRVDAGQLLVTFEDHRRMKVRNLRRNIRILCKSLDHSGRVLRSSVGRAS